MPSWDAATFGVLRVDGYRETSRENILRSDPDLGAGKVRRRRIGKLREIRGSTKLSVTDYGTFLTWFETTVEEGALHFDMTDPIKGGTGSFRIRGFTSESIAGDLVQVNVDLLRVS